VPRACGMNDVCARGDGLLKGRLRIRNCMAHALGISGGIYRVGCIANGIYSLPTTRIWKECGIMGARGPRIHAGVPAGGGAAFGGGAGTGPNSAVIR